MYIYQFLLNYIFNTDLSYNIFDHYYIFFTLLNIESTNLFLFIKYFILILYLKNQIIHICVIYNLLV
jgi:hypothetical protein